MNLNKANIIISFLLCSFAYVSCNDTTEENTVIVNKFPKEKIIRAKVLNWIKPYKPLGFIQIDSFLVVLNSEGKSVFQVYNTNTKSLVVECGKFGRGPGEFLSVGLSNDVLRNDEGRFFHVFSVELKAIFTIDLDKLLTGENYIKEKRMLSTELTIQTHIVKVDSLVIGSSDGTQGKIFSYNTETEELDLWEHSPEISNVNSFNDYELYVLYARSWVYNKSRNLLAGITGTTFNRLDFYTPLGERLKTIELPTIKQEIKPKKFLERVKFYGLDILSSNDKIYSLMTPEAYKDEVDVELGSVISVFDWDGNPNKQYYVQDERIQIFALDSINNKIYGYTPNNPESLMVEFEL